MDDYAECRDQAFLNLLDIRLPTRPLAFFWPRGGPQWDGLGRAASGEVILVEAKAHLNELYSPATGVAGIEPRPDPSRACRDGTGLGCPGRVRLVEGVLSVRQSLGARVPAGSPERHPDSAVFLYLIGDTDVGGPATRVEWEMPIQTVHTALGLPNRLLTAFEVAQFVGCHEETIRRAYLRGLLNSTRFGVRGRRFQPRDVLDWIRRGAPTRVS